jgi:Yip1 domain
MNLLMDAFNTAIALVKNPAGFMAANKDSAATVNDVMVNYVAVLALIPLVATLVGDLWYYSLVTHSGAFVGFAFGSAVLSYIFGIAAVYVIAMAIRVLASNFGSSNDQLRTLKLAAYVYTPAFLISALDIIPLLGFIEIVGVLYGLYVLYLGLPAMLGTPKDKVVPYLMTIVVVTLVVYFVFGTLVGLAFRI